MLALGVVCVLALSLLVAAPTPAGAQPPGSPTAVTVGPTPFSVAITPDGHYAFTADNGDSKVSRVDTTTSPPTVLRVAGFAGNPVAVAISPHSQTVFVLQQSNTDQIDWAVMNTNTLSRNVYGPVRGENPSAVALTPNGQVAYVANAGRGAIPGSVSVLQALSGRETATVDVGGSPNAIAVSPDGQDVYVANRDGNVNVISTSDDEVVRTIRVGDQLNGVAFSPHAAVAYVSGSSGVAVIDTNTRRVTATVKVGREPQGIAVTPDGRFAYVTNQLSNTVNAIDTTTNQVTATLGPERPVEMIGPIAVAITPDGHFAYVVNLNAAQDNLSILPIEPAVTQVTPSFIAAGTKGGVVVSGTNLAQPTDVNFGSNRATSWSCTASSCSTGAPICVVSGHVTVTTAGGTSPTDAANKFTYDLPLAGPALPLATAGSPYATTLVASGGIPPYRWSLPGGALPPGLSLNPTTAVFSGTPSVAGRYDLSFGVADSQTPPVMTSEPRSIVVQQSSCHHTAAGVLEHARVRITRLRAQPLRPGCVTEVGKHERKESAQIADATCRRLRLMLDGVIELHGKVVDSAGGNLSERVHVRLPRGPATRRAHAKVRHGHWRISLIVPGANRDPVPPSYLISLRYRRAGSAGADTARRRVRLGVERAGLQ